jgi:DNA-binding transcriptional regulator YiaG
MEEISMMLPDDVRDARRAMGLTQHDLAVLLRMGGDGKRAVRRWEAGDRHISGPASVAIEAMLTGWRPREITAED